MWQILKADRAMTGRNPALRASPSFSTKTIFCRNLTIVFIIKYMFQCGRS
jgi:hypothetical protein